MQISSLLQANPLGLNRTRKKNVTGMVMNKWTYNKLKVSFKDGLSQHFRAFTSMQLLPKTKRHIRHVRGTKNKAGNESHHWRSCLPTAPKNTGKERLSSRQMVSHRCKEFSFISCHSHALFLNCLQWCLVCSRGDGNRG